MPINTDISTAVTTARSYDTVLAGCLRFPRDLHLRGSTADESIMKFWWHQWLLRARADAQQRFLRILSPGLPPFDSVALNHFLTTAHLRKLCFLKAYFHGWELYQATIAALVFFEDANSVEMLAFGSISASEQLFVFSFSSASDTFDYALLIQHIPPPPSLQTILTKAHDIWLLPSYLSPYVPLLKSFPTITLLTN